MQVILLDQWWYSSEKDIRKSQVSRLIFGVSFDWAGGPDGRGGPPAKTIKRKELN